MTNARTSYFGIDPSTLGFSTADYVMRSTDALFVPIAVILLMLLAAILVHVFIARAIRSRHGSVAAAGWIAASSLTATIAIIGGAWSLFAPLPFSTYYLLPPFLLGLGSAAGAHAAWTHRARQGLERSDEHAVRSGVERLGISVTILLVVLSIFWASTLYADALGVSRAHRLEQSLGSRPEVTVFSKQALDLDEPGVVETHLAHANSAYLYRYTGLRLLIRSGGKYFLLPERWTHSQGAALVLDESPDLRFEFAPGGAR